MGVVDNSLPATESAILVPPPGGETPGKRSRLESDRPSGSKDSIPTTTSQMQVASVDAAGPREKPVRGLTFSFRVDVTRLFHLLGFVWGLQMETTQRRQN